MAIFSAMTQCFDVETRLESVGGESRRRSMESLEVCQVVRLICGVSERFSEIARDNDSGTSK